jgi:Antitoxin Phd_YefM, type II toxin-antitoxin system
MKRYSASELRQNLARVLDEVEHGERVVVERRGRRFHLVHEARVKSPGRVKPFFRLQDRRLLEGGWTWTWEGPGRPLRLAVKRARKPGLKG